MASGMHPQQPYNISPGDFTNFVQPAVAPISRKGGGERTGGGESATGGGGVGVEGGAAHSLAADQGTGGTGTGTPTPGSFLGNSLINNANLAGGAVVANTNPPPPVQQVAFIPSSSGGGAPPPVEPPVVVVPPVEPPVVPPVVVVPPVEPPVIPPVVPPVPPVEPPVVPPVVVVPPDTAGGGGTTPSVTTINKTFTTDYSMESSGGHKNATYTFSKNGTIVPYTVVAQDPATPGDFANRSSGDITWTVTGGLPLVSGSKYYSGTLTVTGTTDGGTKFTFDVTATYTDGKLTLTSVGPVTGGICRHRREVCPRLRQPRVF